MSRIPLSSLPLFAFMPRSQPFFGDRGAAQGLRLPVRPRYLLNCTRIPAGRVFPQWGQRFCRTRVAWIEPTRT